MGNAFYKTKFFKTISSTLTLKTRCYKCKEWHKKACTFKDSKSNKRYCTACAPMGTFKEHIEYNKLTDDTPLITRM